MRPCKIRNNRPRLPRPRLAAAVLESGANMSKLRWLIALLITSLTATAAPGEVQPKGFCECLDHERPTEAASVSGGTRYLLYGYNDAFRSSQTRPWCYTRAVWFERVNDSGRFEWRAAGQDVLIGAIKESDDLCGAYHNHYESAAGPAKQPSTIDHGSVLQSSSSIELHYAVGEQFVPTWPERLKRRISSLVGFASLPPRMTPTRVAVRVTSTVVGSAPPYTIEYKIESPTGTSLNLYEFGQSPTWAERSPRLYWEAAVSREFYDEMVRRQRGFMDGGAPVSIQIKSVQGVTFVVGRLLILPPYVQPPLPDQPAKDAYLLGTASAFTVAPLGAPLPPAGIRVQ